MNGLYAGFAAGLALNRFTGTTTVSSGQGGSVTTRSTDDRTQVFGELLLGYRLQMNYGVEAFVRMSPKFNDVTPSVYGIRASYRF